MDKKNYMVNDIFKKNLSIPYISWGTDELGVQMSLKLKNQINVNDSEYLSLIKKKYISIFKKGSNQKKNIGLELEFPITPIKNVKPNKKFLKNILSSLVDKLGLIPLEFDEKRRCIKAIHPKTKDQISYEVSYCNIEFSLAPQKDLKTLEKHFFKLFNYIQNFLYDNGLQMMPIGINPSEWTKSKDFLVEHPYYQALLFFLKDQSPRKKNNDPYFGLYSAASQVHLNVSYENLSHYTNIIQSLGWVKALLFANSPMNYEKNLKNKILCSRDFLWKNSAFGINELNVGIINKWFIFEDDIFDLMFEKPIFYVKRSNKFIYFSPQSLKKFFSNEKIEGWKLDSNKKQKKEFFIPHINDFQFFRAYNDISLTSKGTLEIRSECQQPLPDIMAPAAFHLGIMSNIDKFLQLPIKVPPSKFSECREKAAYHGYDIQNSLNFDIQDYIYSILDLAKEGLIKRGLGEEKYIECLFHRLEKKTNPAIEYINKNK